MHNLIEVAAKTSFRNVYLALYLSNQSKKSISDIFMCLFPNCENWNNQDSTLNLEILESWNDCLRFRNVIQNLQVYCNHHKWLIAFHDMYFIEIIIYNHEKS